uniref:Uncharacterized protein n=1 Tax=Sinocyclocheilus anshuiensis TaxID=1608454 RepID=A0A671M2Y7_9TELE
GPGPITGMRTVSPGAGPMRKPIEDNVVNGNGLKVYIPLDYSSQIVNGTNYVVKVSECFYLFDFELVNSSLKNKGITCMLPNIN